MERFVLFEEVHEASGGRGTVRRLWREARIAEGWPEAKVGEYWLDLREEDCKDEVKQMCSTWISDLLRQMGTNH